MADMADAPPSINGLGVSVPSGVSGPSDILQMSDDDAGEAWFQVKPWVEMSLIKNSKIACSET